VKSRRCFLFCDELASGRMNFMDKVELDSFRDRMYRAYSTSHSGRRNASVEAVWVKRYIVPLLPADQSSIILDVGCGQGTVVRTLQELGYANAIGVDISPEQVALAEADGINGIYRGDFHEFLRERRGSIGAVLATDVLEHCTKNEVLAAFDAVHDGLEPGGVFIARVPNAGSPFVGRIQRGDFTHETEFAAGSLRQISNVAGFSSSTLIDPIPVPHGIISSVRWALWNVVAVLLKLALAAETGEVRGHYVSQTVVLVARR
jgi:SAM-dependent methyltransferase